MSRREQLREATTEEIKEVARRQMAASGTADLSLRAIAREMGVTAPAIYRYFPSRDELVTALIQDGFSSLSNFLESQVAQFASENVVERLETAVLAYRVWALAHPIDYQIMTASAIPNYVAPLEVLRPVYQRIYHVYIQLLAEAIEKGSLKLPAAYRELPPTIHAHLTAFNSAYQVDLPILYVMVTLWTQMHGRIILEILHQTHDLIGDTDAFYRHETRVMLQNLGVAM